MFWLAAARMASFTCLILLHSVADRYSSSRQPMLATTQLSISATRSTRSRIWAVSLIRCSTFGHLTMSCAASDGIRALARSVLLLPTPCWPAIRVGRLQSPHRAEPRTAASCGLLIPMVWSTRTTHSTWRTTFGIAHKIQAMLSAHSPSSDSLSLLMARYLFLLSPARLLPTGCCRKTKPAVLVNQPHHRHLLRTQIRQTVLVNQT